MTIFYLDLVGGNDANDGTTFANRWKTFDGGATAARIAPGDTIRVMQSANPTSLGQSASWTNKSATVTLTSAVTQTLDNGETAWTASANITTSADAGQYKQGTHSAKIAFGSAFTTGLAAYIALGAPLNLSGYQQVSFWIATDTALAANVLSLRLCSDTAGATTVNTILIPALPSTANNGWHRIVVDTGAALGSSIQSIALYAESDPGTPWIHLDNIIACKASSSADALTHRSLIGKAHCTSWAASTTYSLNDIRKPAPPNRNGLCYKVTTAGTTGTSEPAWPTNAGATVTDGTAVWTVYDLEEQWWPIGAIDGTTVTIDARTGDSAGTTRGYAGVTESVTTYKREAIWFNQTTDLFSVQDSGTDGSPITFSGGWNSTDMSTQTGETWAGNVCGGHAANMFNVGYHNWITLTNFGAFACGYLFVGSLGTLFENCHAVSGQYSAFSQVNNDYAISFVNCAANTCYRGTTTGSTHVNCSTHSCNLAGISPVRFSTFDRCNAYNNGTYGIDAFSNVFGVFKENVLANVHTRDNATAGVMVGGNGVTLVNSDVSNDSVTAVSNGHSATVRHDRYARTADDHRVYYDGGQVLSATDQRHTASGIAWKFTATNNTYCHSANPIILPVAKVAVASGSVVTASIWVRRDNTNIQGTFVCKGGSVPGVDEDVSVSCAPAINTWTQYSVTFTPSAAGAIELEFWAWDSVDTTSNLWVDDLAVTQ